jgi:hypothetical protein
LAGHAFASVLRAAGEEPGSQAVVCDECGGDAGLRLRIAEWRRPSEGAIAFRLWTATLYPVEIAVGQSFGEPQLASILQWSFITPERGRFRRESSTYFGPKRSGRGSFTSFSTWWMTRPGFSFLKRCLTWKTKRREFSQIKPYSSRYLGFYTRDRRFVITAAFEKQTQKLGVRERQHVQTAIIRKQNYLARTAVRTYYRPALPPRRRKT